MADPRLASLSSQSISDIINDQCAKIRNSHGITHDLIMDQVIRNIGENRLLPNRLDRGQDAQSPTPILYDLITNIEKLVEYIKNYGSSWDEEKYKNLLIQLRLVLNGNSEAATIAIQDIERLIQFNHVKCSTLLNILFGITFTLLCIPAFALVGFIITATPAIPTIGTTLMISASMCFAMIPVLLASSSFSHAGNCLLFPKLAGTLKTNLQDSTVIQELAQRSPSR